MEKIEVKWFYAAMVWWAWFWRSSMLLIITVVGLIAILSILFGAEITVSILNEKVTSVSFIIGIAASIRTFKTILNKEFNGYRIALIKTAKIKA